MKKSITLALMGAAAATMVAQNPIITGQFSADPTARVFEGRVYVYPSHDIPPVPHPGAQKNWFCMEDYHVFSSENLVDWTDHGVILDQKDVPWGNKEAYSMWAPDCIQGKDGRYYFYFPDAPAEGRGFGIGVAISDHPYGPFVPQEKRIEGIGGIDPCVLQASTGENVIFWGGGGLRMARLKDNLLELADEELANPQTLPNGMKFYGHAVEGLPDGFKEGPFAFERNGKFYLTYPWVREQGGTECLAYAMADKPMGPYEYKGIIMKESATGCWTNHHSLVEFKGQWYLFYHHNDYSPSFDKNRSVRVDSLNFNADGTIQEVIPTWRGVGVTDAYRILMDKATPLTAGDYTRSYANADQPFEGWKVSIPAGGRMSYADVRLPEGEYQTWVRAFVNRGWRRSGQILPISETALKVDIQTQKNGNATVIVSNTGKEPVEVEWISLSARKPLETLTRGGMETGVYRNVLAEVGYSQADIDKKLQDTFDEVIKNCYSEVGKDMAYISDVKNNDVRTEGMSYGLMIAVQWDKKEMFDRLWRWSKKYMQIQEGPMEGYFRWSCKTSGEANAQGPASDGELYFITSLLFASNLWGNDTGINYLAEAQHILECVKTKEVEMPVRHWGQRPQPGEKPEMRKVKMGLMDPETDLISFVPGMPFTDPSYHIPAFYEVWARYAEDGRASYWRECARKSRAYLHKSIHPVTGLNPDNNNYDGSLIQAGHMMGDCFRYDSWRVPMNIALDYSWSCSDRYWQQTYGNKIQDFFYSQGIDDYVDQYNVDGTRPEKILKAGNYPEKLRHGVGLVATTAAASLLCTHDKSYDFIDRLWNQKHVPDADGYFDGYYDSILRLFALMHLSGRYRMIEKEMQYSSYFAPVEKGAEMATPDEQGFIRRWRLQDPIDKPNNTNAVFTDSYLNKELNADYSAQEKNLAWHEVDSKLWHVKLYRFATCRNKQRYGVLFKGETEIWCDEDITDIRLAAGSNSASMWWLNGEEVLLLSGDRRMVQDDGLSRKITLKKGRNVLKCAVINGPGMSDFCVRFLDADGKPVTNIKVQIPQVKGKKK